MNSSITQSIRFANILIPIILVLCVLFNYVDMQGSVEIIFIILSILWVVLNAISHAHSTSQKADNAELERSKAKESLERDRILTIVNNLADA
ncbi:MAG: hypothetical protein JWM07_666, partial [Candidatus Saccharibacteria bacterium]|nr:hypothetical protein [Candidatus Saccharibacteria bacterium]